MNKYESDGGVINGSKDLLMELHILTRDGRINQDSRRKLKQVNHLIGFVEKILQNCFDSDEAVKIVDHGAGKSYFGFLIYDLLGRNRKNIQIYGVERRAELVATSTKLAEKMGIQSNVHFIHSEVLDSAADTAMPEQVDIVTALHACDTATDDAIAFALAKRARAMCLVPCCQAELARTLSAGRALQLGRTPLAELWRHPIHARELGSQLTNVLRCLYLEANGYKVSVTELVGWEHSMKNELIVAEYTGQKRRSAAQRMLSLAEQFGLQSLLTLRFPNVSSIC